MLGMRKSWGKMRERTKRRINHCREELKTATDPRRIETLNDIIQESLKLEQEHIRSLWIIRIAFGLIYALLIVFLANIILEVAPKGSPLSELGALIVSYVPKPSRVIDGIVAYSPIIIVLIGILSALFLFALRGYAVKIYGFLEICIGVVTIQSTAPALTIDNIPSAIPFSAGIYVVIRGLDNVAKGLKKTERLGRLFSRLFNNPVKDPPS